MVGLPLSLMVERFPGLTFGEFVSRLRRVSPVPLGPAAELALHVHYREMRRWSEGLSLVGPGTAGEVVERHYGESLVGLCLVPEGARSLVDLGSGAGFPGWVLAAARPGLQVTLVEPHRRKWAFLEAATQKAALSCVCLDARVGASLPGGFPEQIDVITSRALKLDPAMLRALSPRLSASARLLLWQGETPGFELPGFVEEAGVPVPGSRRRVVAYLAARPDEGGS